MIGEHPEKEPGYSFDEKSSDILMTSISTDDCDIDLRVDHLGNIKLQIHDAETVTLVFDGFQAAILGRALCEYARRAKAAYAAAGRR